MYRALASHSPNSGASSNVRWGEKLSQRGWWSRCTIYVIYPYKRGKNGWLKCTIYTLVFAGETVGEQPEPHDQRSKESGQGKSQHTILNKRHQIIPTSHVKKCPWRNFLDTDNFGKFCKRYCTARLLTISVCLPADWEEVENSDRRLPEQSSRPYQTVNR